MTTASPPPNTNIPGTRRLVNTFLSSCVDRGLSQETLRSYSGILMPFSTSFPELPKTPEDIEHYIGSYQSGDERRFGVYRVLRNFYNFTCSRLEIKNPMTKVIKPRVSNKAKRALSLEQIHQLLTYPKHNEMIRALLYLLTDTGIRLGEAAGIKAADISGDSLKVKGKTGERIVPISPEVREMLIKIAPLSTYKNQSLFPVTKLYLCHQVTRAMKAAGLQGFTAHSLRHTFATRWTGSDSALKQITGHKSWAMIDRYKHESDAAAASQHQLHGPLAQLNGVVPATPPVPTARPIQMEKTTNDLPASWQDDPELIRSREEMLFVWHALQHNIAARLGELFDRYAKTEERNSLNEWYVTFALVETYAGDKGEDDLKERMTKSANFIITEFWHDLSQLAKRTAASEYLEAARFLDSSLLGGEIDIEDIILEPTPMSWKQKQVKP